MIGVSTITPKTEEGIITARYLQRDFRQVVAKKLVPNSLSAIKNVLDSGYKKRLDLTIGGTGISPNDVVLRPRAL